MMTPLGRGAGVVEPWGLGGVGQGGGCPQPFPHHPASRPETKLICAYKSKTKKKTILTKSYRGLFPRAVYIGSQTADTK